MSIAQHEHFVYCQSMIVEYRQEDAVSRIAAAIGDPSRARILFSLLDGHARTSTELAMVAEVSPSTASVHLARLKSESLVKIREQGKHRYYSLQCAEVARALEALSVVAGGTYRPFAPRTPLRLRNARTCYDHLAGSIAVALHDSFIAAGWLLSCIEAESRQGVAYDLSTEGEDLLRALGIDIPAIRKLRRRFAYACLDWSERKPHIGGALGAALLQVALQRKWIIADLDSRVLTISRKGQRDLQAFFGLAHDLFT